MKKCLLLVLLFTQCLYAQVSPFSSTVIGIQIPNAHTMNSTGTVIRGMEPRKLLQGLAEYGVTDVLIFKNSTKGEVEKELVEVEELGMTSHHIPFRWKSFESAQQACEQVIEAILLIKKLEEQGKTTYFHCTVGEDRTGLLAGVFRMVSEGWSSDRAFEEEMCAHGYAEGNPNKPGMVVGAIHKELTPLFDYITKKIESGIKISKTLCKNIKLSESTRRCN